jgi:hypothetical protein
MRNCFTISRCLVDDGIIGLIVVGSVNRLVRIYSGMLNPLYALHPPSCWSCVFVCGDLEIDVSFATISRLSEIKFVWES